ncbi:MAG: tRNA 4-thiouridine(8) synthase ThiI, partial [Nitrospinae bacterium]|nr:tRNA 4-thiouridine(8) synthase ThiI [Nitrospinota bacterium]
YEISIIPDQDCCTLFIPPNPVVRSECEEIARMEARLDMRKLVQEGVEGVKVIDFVQEGGHVRVCSGELQRAGI